LGFLSSHTLSTWRTLLRLSPPRLPPSLSPSRGPPHPGPHGAARRGDEAVAWQRCREEVERITRGVDGASKVELVEEGHHLDVVVEGPRAG
jgi:hypothetical protein